MTDGSIESGEKVTRTSETARYNVAFSEVWEVIRAVIASLRGWEVRESDSQHGTIRLITRHPLGYRPLEASVWLSLDDLGQTRLEIRFDEPRHPLRPPSAPRRARRFLTRVDRALGIRRRP